MLGRCHDGGQERQLRVGREGVHRGAGRGRVAVAHPEEARLVHGDGVDVALVAPAEDRDEPASRLATEVPQQGVGPVAALPREVRVERVGHAGHAGPRRAGRGAHAVTVLGARTMVERKRSRESAGSRAPRKPGKGLMSTTTGRPPVISRSTPYSCRPRAAPAARAVRVQSSGRSAGARRSSKSLSKDSSALRRRAADRSAPITHALISNPSFAANSWAATGSSPHSGSSPSKSVRLVTRRTRSWRELGRVFTTSGHGKAGAA